MGEKLNRFINLLKGIFELDKADLDFGIYRILNIRRSQIEEFLTDGLPKRVQETLKPFAEDTSALTARIAEIEKLCGDVGVDVEKSKMAEEYAQHKSKLARGVDLSSIESDVYSALFSFFNRYYDEGDFISKRRYKEGVYAIPYEGEEVKLYWANADQYYIKTAENFRDYTFTCDGKMVHFRLVGATTERNNNKETNSNGRVFMLYTGATDRPDIKTIEEVDGELIVRFVYDIPEDKKKKYAEDNLALLTDEIQMNYRDWYRLLAPAPTAKKETRSLLEKHLTAYVAKNTFDYFIHKDLRGFLTRELDFFIKSEVIHLDDIDTTDEKRADNYLAKVRAIKRVGKIIIDFLAQIEDFQKKLWLKKKFVVATNWCVTLDYIDEAFYPEIISNAAQIAEWVDVYAINEIQGDMFLVGYSDPLTVEFLRQNGNLVLDTLHFSADFKDRLVASIDNLDEQTGGLMLHSENFQALGLLRERYRGQVKCIYIDPPYNADASVILYKNGFKHSSWLSLMENRLVSSRSLMSDTSMICVTIDDCEKDNVSLLLSDTFSTENLQAVVPIRNNPQGRSTVKGFAINHEYALFYSNSEELHSVGRLVHTQMQKARYSQNDEGGQAYLWENLRKTGTDSNRADRPRQYYPIFVDVDKMTIRIPAIKWDMSLGSWVLTENPETTEQIVYPLTRTGEEKVWKWGIDRTQSSLGQLRAEKNGNGLQIYIKNYYNDEGSLPNTWWDEAKYAAGSHGTNLLTDIFGVNRTFQFPKSVYAVEDCLKVCNVMAGDIILDYFAGSGTTGHAVLNLNRTDDGDRRYILVEMGEYFNTVTLPRMKKVIYSAEWKDGKPQNRNTGASHIMKYLVLESYEDALSNVVLDDSMNEQLTLFGDDYLINYMFSYESRDSLLRTDDFRNPWGYKLKIAENNETKGKIIDLCETFNYLIGLSVTSQSPVRAFEAAADGKEYEGSVSLTSGSEYAFKQIEGKLPDGRRALVIWRTVTNDILRSNAALDAYFTKHRINPADREFDVIYVNCDSNLENLRGDNEEWKVQRIEPLFKTKMFEEVE